MERKVNASKDTVISGKEDSYQVVTAKKLNQLFENKTTSRLKIEENCLFNEALDNVFDIKVRGNVMCAESILTFKISAEKDFCAMSHVCMNTLKVKVNAVFEDTVSVGAGINVDGHCKDLQGVINTSYIAIGKDFISEGDILLEEIGQIIVYGDLYCEKSINCVDIVVHGNVHCNGSINAGNMHVKGNVFCKGNVNLASATFEKGFEIKGQKNISHLKIMGNEKINLKKKVS